MAFGILAFLAWVPAPLGSNRPLFWCINGLIAGLLLLCQCIVRPRRIAPWIGWPEAALAALIVGWMLVQAFWPAPAALRPSAWEEAFRLLSNDGPAVLSLDPWATLLASVRFLTCVALYLVVASYTDGRSQRRERLLRALMWIMVIYAVYANVAHRLFPGTLLWLKKWAYLESLTGTFVNRNSAAAFFGIGLAIALARLLVRSRSLAERGRISWIKVDRFVSEEAWTIFAAVILALSVIDTHSRGGLFSTAVMATAGGFVTLKVGGQRRIAPFTIALATLALMGLVAAVSPVAERVGTDTASFDSRLALFRSTWEMISAKPFFGHGAGSFPVAFPPFRDPELSPDYVWLQAHNVYLELWAELGAGTLLMVVLVAQSLLRVVCAAQSTEAVGGTSQWAATAALMAWLLLAVQGLYDFGLQSPAVALWAVGLLAIASPKPRQKKTDN
jgi:O-antigen ligase